MNKNSYILVLYTFTILLLLHSTKSFAVTNLAPLMDKSTKTTEKIITLPNGKKRRIITTKNIVTKTKKRPGKKIPGKKGGRLFNFMIGGRIYPLDLVSVKYQTQIKEDDIVKPVVYNGVTGSINIGAMAEDFRVDFEAFLENDRSAQNSKINLKRVAINVDYLFHITSIHLIGMGLGVDFYNMYARELSAEKFIDHNTNTMPKLNELAFNFLLGYIFRQKYYALDIGMKYGLNEVTAERLKYETKMKAKIRAQAYAGVSLLF